MSKSKISEQLKICKRIERLSKSQVRYVVGDQVHFMDKGGSIWITLDLEGASDIQDRYSGSLEKSEKYLGLDMDVSFEEVDISGVPKGIVDYVSKDDLRLGLRGICIDVSARSVVATDGHVLYSHDIFDVGTLSGSIILSSEFFKLLGYFGGIGKIYTDGVYSIYKGVGVTVVGKLIDVRYPDWEKCLPLDGEEVEFSLLMRDRILYGLREFNRVGKLKRVIFDGCYMKVVTEAGVGYEFDLGFELFPGRVIQFLVDMLKRILKIVVGGGELRQPDTERSVVLIRGVGGVFLIMPFPLPVVLQDFYLELK